jgi:hypothetical protein
MIDLSTGWFEIYDYGIKGKPITMGNSQAK